MFSAADSHIIKKKDSVPFGALSFSYLSVNYLYQKSFEGYSPASTKAWILSTTP